MQANERINWCNSSAKVDKLETKLSTEKSLGLFLCELLQHTAALLHPFPIVCKCTKNQTCTYQHTLHFCKLVFAQFIVCQVAMLSHIHHIAFLLVKLSNYINFNVNFVLLLSFSSCSCLQVYLWDQRGGSAPRTKLGSGLGFSMNTLQLSDGANLLLVGAQTGDVSKINFIMHVNQLLNA